MAPAWGSKWLQDSANCDTNMDSHGCEGNEQSATTSGRQHGTRWFNVVQGIRRSLDVHLKSYCKIDSAFASSLKQHSASDKLRSLTRGLTATGLTDFCCIYLVHPVCGTFGTVALSGPGAELYPTLLSEHASPCFDDGNQTAATNFFTRSVFQVQDSNWAVEDVVASRAPWYYDCASAANGYGLPQEASWLRRVGMRSVLALPCMHDNDVYGVMVVATRQKTLDHLLLRKLEELCYKVTPVVVDAAVEHSSSLGNRRLVSRYESVSDFAHAVLGEMLNLDRAVVVSINSSCQQPNGGSAAGCGTSGVTAPNASQQRLHQRQQSIAAAAAAAAATAPTKGSKPSKGGNGSSGGRFNAAAAVAAAAAAGFTWTARGGVEASAPTPTVSGCFARMRQGRQAAAVAAAVAAFNSHNQQQLAAAAACQVSSTGQQQQQRPACTAHLTVGNVSGTSFCSAVTTAVTCNSTTFTTLTEVPSARLPSELLSPSRPSAPALPQNPSGQSSAPPSPLLAPSLEPTATGAAAQARHQLPTAAGGNSAALTEMLLAEQRHVRQARLGACGVSAPHSAAASRSTRSMSCMELSGGIGDTAREALLLDTAHLTGASATLSPTAAAATTLASSSFGWQHMRPAGCLAANCAAPASPSAAPSSKPSPIAQQQQFRPPRVQVQAPLLRAGEISPGGVSSRRSTDSDGSPFMLDGANTTGSGDLIAPRSFMMRGPTSSSTQHMFQRGQPLDPSTGRPPHGAVNLGSASAYSSLGRLGPSAAAHLAAALSLAAGSTSNRDAVAVANASGTNTGGSSPATGESSVCGLTVSTNVTCTTFHSSSHRFTSGQLTAQGSLGVCASSNLIACANASGATEAGGASRWSRDSAAAAAAMWGSEAADAFAAAMRFTTGYPYGAGAPCVPSGGRRASHSASASGYAKSALGGLYGIAESGSIPAGHGSDGGSSCEDCGVALAEMQSECVGVGYKGCQGSSNGGTCAGEVLSEGMPRVVHASLVAHAQ